MADAWAVEAYPTRDAAYDAVAQLLMVRLETAARADGRTAFAAAGGTTPAPVYERMADRAAPWRDIHVTLTDERWTPPTSAESNEAMIRRTLLTHKGAYAPFTPLWSDTPSVQGAAEVAETRLSQLPAFGAVLLGMGADGHIASLFPGSAALVTGLDPHGPRRCVAVAPAQPAPDNWRISQTLSSLLRSSLIVLLITGADKRALIEYGAAGQLPVHALLGRGGEAVRIFWAP